MVGERLEGALTTLERIGAEKAKEIHQRLKDPRFFLAFGRHKQPPLDELRSDLTDESLFVFQVFPEAEDKPIAYAGIILYSGPPYAFCEFFDAKLDIDMAQDVILQLVHGFFRRSDEEELWLYMPRPINDDAHDRLGEGGFDLYDDDLPGIDSKKVAAYRMQRHTYDAYYGEEGAVEDRSDEDEGYVGGDDE